jgi:DNA-binding transcriptional LysR family regulator
MAASLAQSGNAFALMTEHRAILAANDGLVYRRLTPTPVIEYGAAYHDENRSPALTNLIKTVEDIAPPLPADLPVDSELFWVGPDRGRKVAN